MILNLYCNNKPTIRIAHNTIQHERIKRIEIDWHFIKEKPDNCLIINSYIPSKFWLAKRPSHTMVS